VPPIHQPLPQPVIPITPEMHVKDVGGEPVVEVSWDDYIEFSKYLQDIKRYLAEQKIMICDYRKDLNEEYCK